MKKLLLLALLLVGIPRISFAQGSRQTDSLALVAFYTSTVGSDWAENANWLSAQPLEKWFGITVTNNRVTGIILEDNGLSGALPKEIGMLNALDTLALAGNTIAGTIPTEIGNLTKLHYFDLQATSIVGEIPVSIKNMTELTALYLSSPLTGSIPKEIGELKKLEILAIYNTKMSGPIPKEIGNLSNLKNFYSVLNGLTGAIPAELGNLKSLVTLELNANQLSGSIPPELGNLANLRILVLNYNKLTGSIPAELGKCTNLDSLFMRDNQLSGSLPKELGNLKKLSKLSVRDNNLSGEIPEEFNELSNLTELRLSNNSFTGGLLYLPPKYNSLWIFGNKFNFDELENQFICPDYQYAPQDTLGKDTTIEVPVAGQELQLGEELYGLKSTTIRYQWYKDGVAIPGATSRNYVITNFQKSNNGFYSTSATDTKVPNLTLYSAKMLVTLKGSVGVEEGNSPATTLTVEPNPAIADQVIVGNSNLQITVTQLHVVNILGEVVRSMDTPPARATIDVRDLPNGVYRLVAVTAEGAISTSLVIQH